MADKGEPTTTGAAPSASPAEQAAANPVPAQAGPSPKTSAGPNAPAAGGGGDAATPGDDVAASGDDVAVPGGEESAVGSGAGLSDSDAALAAFLSDEGDKSDIVGAPAGGDTPGSTLGDGLNPPEIEVADPDAVQVGPADLGAVQVGAADLDPVQVGAADLDPTQVGAADLDAPEGRAVDLEATDGPDAAASVGTPSADASGGEKVPGAESHGGMSTPDAEADAEMSTPDDETSGTDDGTSSSGAEVVGEMSGPGTEVDGGMGASGAGNNEGVNKPTEIEPGTTMADEELDPGTSGDQKAEAEAAETTDLPSTEEKASGESSTPEPEAADEEAPEPQAADEEAADEEAAEPQAPEPQAADVEAADGEALEERAADDDAATADLAAADGTTAAKHSAEDTTAVDLAAEGAAAGEDGEDEGAAGRPVWPPANASTTGNIVTTQRRPATLDDLAPLPFATPSAGAVPTMASGQGAEGARKAEKLQDQRAERYRPEAARQPQQAAQQLPPEPPPALSELAAALSGLRSAIGASAYPLKLASADEARTVGSSLVSQLDDYLLPRLARLDAPLLVVVGGSTGAGKSTLVNSLVRAPVSTAGVLRPTTRSPVLVSHPSDSSWFRRGELLPGLVRTQESSNDPRALQLVSAPALGPGLAFLDAPDVDSVVEQNRKLAAQLLAAADLWLFVTTAARYADAVPWELLKTARLRGTVIALVLDRVPAEAAAEISAHLGEMLTEHAMGEAPLFVLPETTLDRQGLLPEDVMRGLHDWFAQLAADANARSAVVRQTLDGALASLGPAVEGLAAAADEQAAAAQALDERVALAYRTARRTVEDGLRDGRLLRGEVLTRWQEFVGTGEIFKTLESRIGQLRDKMIAAVTGRPAPSRSLRVALESQLVTLMRGVASDAAEQAYAAWQAFPAGAELLEADLQKPSKDLPQRAERVVRDWQQWVLDMVRAEAGDKRFVARGAAYAVNGVGLAVMIAVFTSTAFIPTGAEIAVGAGTTVAAQKVLEAIFGDQAIRTLAARARDELMSRVDGLLDAEAARFTDRTAAAGLELEPGNTLRRAANDVERSRQELALTGQSS